MKIAFIGDSITQGIPGISYVDIIREKTGFICDNYGRGGDTFKSTYRRTKRIKHLDEYDLIVLYVGVNERYGRISKRHRILKVLSNRMMCKNNEELNIYYKELLDYITSKTKQVIVIPALIIGEDLSNDWNQSLIEVNEVIEYHVKNYKNVIYLNILDTFKNYLKIKTTNDYIPKNITVTGKDVLVRNKDEIDQISKERGLHLTLDGVHMNTTGATLIAEEVINILKQVKQ